MIMAIIKDLLYLTIWIAVTIGAYYFVMWSLDTHEYDVGWGLLEFFALVLTASGIYAVLRVATQLVYDVTYIW